MDGDVFGRVTRLGPAAVEAVARAIGGESWDAFYASRCFDELIVGADGIPSLVTVVTELDGLRALPLIARFETEGALQRIRDATLAPGCTELDLILKSNVERTVLRGEFTVRPILERFCGQLIERAVLTGRAGFMEEHGASQLDQVRAVLAPVASAAAAALEARPTAKRLGLGSWHVRAGKRYGGKRPRRLRERERRSRSRPEIRTRDASIGRRPSELAKARTSTSRCSPTAQPNGVVATKSRSVVSRTDGRRTSPSTQEGT